MSLYLNSSGSVQRCVYRIPVDGALWQSSVCIPLNAKLNPICHLLALLGAHHILHVSRIRVNQVSKPLNAKLNSICHLLALLGAHRILHVSRIRVNQVYNTLNAKLNPIWHLLALLGAHHILHVSRIRVKTLTNSWGKVLLFDLCDAPCWICLLNLQHTVGL